MEKEGELHLLLAARQARRGDRSWVANDLNSECRSSVGNWPKGRCSIQKHGGGEWSGASHQMGRGGKRIQILMAPSN